MLKIQNLCKSINGKSLLRDINIEIAPGEIGILLGSSGAGKSTLLRILNHLEDYDSGSFFLDGQELDLTKVNTTHTIGIVFQHFNLFENLSVEENVTLALLHLKKMSPEEAKERAATLLQQYGLYEERHRSVVNISGGQKQRLAIARTLATNPKVTCLDEPTSALDPTLTHQVAKYITQIASEGRIVLLSTHDTTLFQHLHAKIFFLHSGTIAEACTTEEYATCPDKYPLIKNYF